MPTEVKMPQLGESVVEGTVTRWLKQEGDAVEEFEPLVEINTDKVDTEIPAPASGTLLKVFIPEGETVDAGTLLAMIGAPGEAVPSGSGAEGARPVGETQPSAAAREPSVRADGPGSSRREELGFISPVVARMAAEHDIDLRAVQGTGRGGRITKKDVLTYLESEKAAEAPARAPWEEPASGELFRPTEEVFGAKKPAKAEKAPPTAGQVQPLSPVRKSIAEHMVRSKHTSPHVTTVMEADLSQVFAHRRSNKDAYARDGVNLTLGAYFAAAAVEALKAFPIVNSAWTDEGVLIHRQVNLGIAVSLGDQGLIVPVIKQAASMSLRGLAQAIGDLAERARSKKLKPEEVQGGTFTITNHGINRSLFATPIINQPQCAILGVGAVQKRVVVVEAPLASGETNDVIAVRPMVYVSLTFDHRILDGAVADQYLGTVVDRLEQWG